MKFQDLINGGIIVDASVAGFQILGQSTFIDQAAEPQICFEPVVECFYVLRFQNLTNELQGGIAAEFRLQTAAQSAGQLPAGPVCPTSHRYQ